MDRNEIYNELAKLKEMSRSSIKKLDEICETTPSNTDSLIEQIKCVKEEFYDLYEKSLGLHTILAELNDTESVVWDLLFVFPYYKGDKYLKKITYTDAIRGEVEVTQVSADISFRHKVNVGIYEDGYTRLYPFSELSKAAQNKICSSLIERNLKCKNNFKK